MADVFSSYHVNSAKDVVQRIRRELEQRKISCWDSETDIHGGQYFAGLIPQQIDACRVFLVILDDDANQSYHVSTELHLAVQRLAKGETIDIIPFSILEKPVSDDLRYNLTKFQRIIGHIPPTNQDIVRLVDNVESMIADQEHKELKWHSQEGRRGSGNRIQKTEKRRGVLEKGAEVRAKNTQNTPRVFLSVDFSIQTRLGGVVTNPQFLGEGGQGIVYKVSYHLGGKKSEKALKWYKPSSLRKNAFYENIWQNVMRGRPSQEFLWPIDITNWDGDTFGYVMDLKPEGYYELTDFMLCHCRFPTYKKAIEAALQIVSAFSVLHNDGYSYQDLNDGNFFINPETGKALICDNDNVAPNMTETGIMGKPRYMAPEIVLNKIMPNTLSDRFSLSVILYILFCLNHPLEGKRSLFPLTPQLQKKLYGEDPIFIMDPYDDRNSPDPVVHRNSIAVWNCLPEYIRKLFLAAFGKTGLNNPLRRPSETQWIEALTRFHSDTVVCEKCGNDIFTQNGVSCPCDKCGKIPEIPVKITLPAYSIPALKGCRLYRCQLGVYNERNALSPIAQVVEKKNSLGVLGIRNESVEFWDATTTKGENRKVRPGEAVPLKPGIVFNIEQKTVKLESNQR